MESILEKAIRSAQLCKVAYSKFVTPNDTGATKAHQAGYHIHKSAWPILFDEEGEKGINKEKFATIRWQDDFERESRFIYYGRGTRNEYRITRFGRQFPYLTTDNVGDLLILCKINDDFYEAFVLQTDDDIEEFFAALNITPNDTNGIIPAQFATTNFENLLECFEAYIGALEIDFPTTIEIADQARHCYTRVHGKTEAYTRKNPDEELMKWLDAEFKLFKSIENVRYSNIIANPFESVDSFVAVANTVLNRRKSRAGRSLEHHLEHMFNLFKLNFDAQATTENNRKPDFIFPNVDAYYNPDFNEANLVMLASKTTCKDRWRQVLKEADRIRTKHLFTLQQGVSTNQLYEMYDNGICLVIPRSNIDKFPKDFRPHIKTLDAFIGYVMEKQH